MKGPLQDPKNAGPRIAILASFSGTGGVEKMVSNLAMGLSEMGVLTDLVLIRSDHMEYLEPRKRCLRVIKLGASHNISALPGVKRYLEIERPDALLAAKDRAILVAGLARLLSRRGPTRIVGRLGTTVSEGVRDKNAILRLVRYLEMRFSYRIIDDCICVSKGVAEDLSRITGLPETRFHVAPNPVITPSLYQKAKEPPKHPWLAQKDVPVILGMGRLTRQKDFETLVRAFHLCKTKRPMRLIILGEGRKRKAIENLRDRLGLRGWIDLPGFSPNPYPYLAAADLFVLSSRWEGSPNALTEALALGTPVVSTDCPSGPREILKQGRFGPVVPVGDPERLSEAILRTLKNPLQGEVLKDAVRDYTVENSAKRYLEILLPKTQSP